MMARPAEFYLARFDLGESTELSLDLIADPDQPSVWTPEPEDDPEARVAEAHDAGYAEGLEAARAEAAAEREGAERAFEERLAAERQKWSVEQSEVLTENLGAAIRQMQETLAECVGQVLRPFVIDLLRKQMLADLVEAISSISAAHEGIAIRIAGPADLLNCLKETLAALPLAVDYEPAEGVDVHVTADQTVIETRLRAWIDVINARSE
jgi:flagellar biosynthesis/type III secretory pathway protein FliH